MEFIIINFIFEQKSQIFKKIFTYEMRVCLLVCVRISHQIEQQKQRQQ